MPKPLTSYRPIWYQHLPSVHDMRSSMNFSRSLTITVSLHATNVSFTSDRACPNKCRPVGDSNVHLKSLSLKFCSPLPCAPHPSPHPPTLGGQGRCGVDEGKCGVDKGGVGGRGAHFPSSTTPPLSTPHFPSSTHPSFCSSHPHFFHPLHPLSSLTPPLSSLPPPPPTYYIS